VARSAAQGVPRPKARGDLAHEPVILLWPLERLGEVVDLQMAPPTGVVGELVPERARHQHDVVGERCRAPGSTRSCQLGVPK
jgi:hypothetical protein